MRNIFRCRSQRREPPGVTDPFDQGGDSQESSSINDPPPPYSLLPPPIYDSDPNPASYNDNRFSPFLTTSHASFLTPRPSRDYLPPHLRHEDAFRVLLFRSEYNAYPNPYYISTTRSVESLIWSDIDSFESVWREMHKRRLATDRDITEFYGQSYPMGVAIQTLKKRYKVMKQWVREVSDENGGDISPYHTYTEKLLVENVWMGLRERGCDIRRIDMNELLRQQLMAVV